MSSDVLQFLYGGLTVMCVAIGFFFLRFWHESRDRFYLWFMTAFWALGTSWGVHLADRASTDGAPHVYLFRLIGFLLIFAAIVDKNRRTT